MALEGGRRRCRGGIQTENYVYRRHSRFLAGRPLSFMEAAVGWVLALGVRATVGHVHEGKRSRGAWGLDSRPASRRSLLE
jgi:hypothetical protein